MGTVRAQDPQSISRRPTNILIAEDDRPLAAALARILEDNGYDADLVHNGEEAVDYALAGQYDVIILDVMLPRKDGFAITSELRRANLSTPILLLTARGATSDKITGYDPGADDYMTKPFSPAELMAYLRALTRRQGDVVFEKLTAGDLTLDLGSYELSCAGRSIKFSCKEFTIARIFMSNLGVTLSKETLIAKAWGIDSSAGDNNVEAYVSFLRKKLAHVGSGLKIETIRMAGYRLTE